MMHLPVAVAQLSHNIADFRFFQMDKLILPLFFLMILFNALDDTPAGVDELISFGHLGHDFLNLILLLLLLLTFGEELVCKTWCLPRLVHYHADGLWRDTELFRNFRMLLQLYYRFVNNI